MRESEPLPTADLTRLAAPGGNDLLRTLAFYLPQFHPIAENDEWWGKGFTEWTNVVQARPRFRSHYQPHLAGELGYYDLRLPEARAAQAGLARAHGVHGFIWYHYWFAGRRVLQRPFDEVLASGEPDFPFALCWANENWTRTWDGGDQQVLLAQRYSDDDDRAHIEHLLPALHDPRYIRVGDKPLLLIYRPSLLPEPHRTTDTWRTGAQASGLPGLHLCRVDRFASESRSRPEHDGFDAAVEFQPDGQGPTKPRLVDRVRLETARRAGKSWPARATVFDYSSVARAWTPASLAWTQYPCVAPGWDNSARRRMNATVLSGSTPQAYADWLDRAARSTLTGQAEPLLFINAWNEWAEGAHLEPDARWGRAYLEATRRVIERHGAR